MSGFWAGAISGIIGALVGGFFTAWAGRMQANAAFRVAAIQIDETNRQQHAAAVADLRRRAVFEISLVLERISNECGEIAAQHHHKASDGWRAGGPCSGTAEFPEILRTHIRDMDRAQALYQYLLPTDAQDVFDSVFESSVLFEENWRKLVAEASKYTDLCAFGEWADNASSAAYRAIRGIREASGLVEIDASIVDDTGRE